MHGTGTSLGDPIEVNAALAALLPAPPPAGGSGDSGGVAARLPLQLLAAKAAAGHAEAAAGVVGFAAAALAVEGLCHPSILHLRCVSPRLQTHETATTARSAFYFSSCIQSIIQNVISVKICLFMPQIFSATFELALRVHTSINPSVVCERTWACEFWVDKS